MLQVNSSNVSIYREINSLNMLMSEINSSNQLINCDFEEQIKRAVHGTAFPLARKAFVQFTKFFLGFFLGIFL